MRARCSERLDIAAIPAICLVILGCGGGGGGANDAADATQPGPCAQLPLRQTVEAEIAAKVKAAMTAAGQNPVEAIPAQDKYRFDPSSFFPYEQVKAREEVAEVYATRDALAKNKGMQNFSGLIDDLTVDWQTESVLVILAWPGQFSYAYGVSGDKLTVHAGHILPCEAYPEADLHLYFGAEPLLLRVPKVTSVVIERYEARYRFADIQKSDRCKREPSGPVIVMSGGDPCVLAENGGHHMWYGGFSAATGVVIDTSSKDGIAWNPPGWDQAHMGKFKDHSPYSEHYRPAVIPAAGGGYTIYYLDGDFKFKGKRVIARSSGTDGVNWQDETLVLEKGPAGAWDGERISGPALLVHGGKHYLYYSGMSKPWGTISIGLATSQDAATWDRHPENPVLSPGEPGRFDDLAVFAPVVLHDGTRFVMLYTAAHGGGYAPRPQSLTIGVARSDDGVHWEHEDKPILAGEGDWDALGVGTPAAVLEKGSITTWFTGINVKAEPSIGRAVCKI